MTVIVLDFEGSVAANWIVLPFIQCQPSNLPPRTPTRDPKSWPGSGPASAPRLCNFVRVSSDMSYFFSNLRKRMVFIGW